MAEEVELVSDGETLAVVGEQNAVEAFLEYLGLLKLSKEFRIERLGFFLGRGADAAHAASELSAKAGRFVKLTKESAERMSECGLMPTKTKGISHAMLGDPGHINKWLQVEDTAGAFLTNPAVLSGAAGVLAQLARQHEARELRELLERIDEKLDDVRQRQRDEVLAKLDRVVEAVENAKAIREYEGDTQTAWEKVVSESGTIAEIRGDALRALEALADKVTNKAGIGSLAKSMREVEQEVAVWLAVLARCFQLDDDYKDLELDHVLDTAPATVERHRMGLADTLQKRRAKISKKTQYLVSKLEEASGFAASNVVLHARAARAIVESVNNVGDSLEEFHRPIDIEFSRDVKAAVRWRDAVRDPQQLRNATAEVGPKLGAMALTGGALVVGAVLNGRRSNGSSSSS